MVGSARRMSLVSRRLPAIVIAWTGLNLAAVTVLAQSPPVRGGVNGELRTPSGFSAITVAPDNRTPPSHWRRRVPRGIRQLHVVTQSAVTSVGLVDDIPDRSASFAGEASSAKLVDIIQSAAMSQSG